MKGRKTELEKCLLSGPSIYGSSDSLAVSVSVTLLVKRPVSMNLHGRASLLTYPAVWPRLPIAVFVCTERDDHLELAI